MSDFLRDPLRSEPLALSAAGEARRERMLGDLSAVVRRSGRRRAALRRTRAAGAYALLLLLVASPVLVLLSLSPRHGGGRIIEYPPDAFLEPPLAPAPPPEPQAPAFEIVRTNPSDYLAALVYTRVDLDALAMDDKELVHDLRAAGRPTGLMRIDGRVRLTAPVTDAELFPKPAPQPPGGS